MIRLEGIGKSFASARALDDVTVEFAASSVHGLLGENGAGKSTLMNVLFGLLRADTGSIVIDGKPARIASPADARAHGIGMVHQHFTLVPTLSVVDNLALAAQAGLGQVPRPAWRARLRALAEPLGWRIDPDVRCGELAVGEQQRVEIVKALAVGGRALILDEPTAVLTPSEALELFSALRGLTARGTAVVFISHKLAEVEAICDRVTILRRGRVVHAGPLAGLTRERMTELMVGAPVETVRKPPTRLAGEMVVEARALTVAGRGVEAAVGDATFMVRAGEIVGVAGVEGNGQRELVRALLGLERPRTGELMVAGAALHRGEVPDRARLGIIPDDRRHEALVLPLSVTRNLLLGEHRRKPFAIAGWLRFSRWRARAAELAGAYDVRAASLGQPVSSLSGGNQQKVVVARELHGGPRLVVAVNPTRGLDIGATAFVMSRLVQARELGAAVLLVHSDLDELLGIADRVLVMCAGRLVDSGWPVAGRDAVARLMMSVDASTHAATGEPAHG